MAKRSDPLQAVTELIRRGMDREGYDSRQIRNALKLWKTLYPKIAKNIQQPALWAAAVELAVARLELEEEERHTRIARKYGVKSREVKDKCDEIWRELNIQPFDPRFCSMPQILADMIMGDEDLQKQVEKYVAQEKKSKKPKTPPPPPSHDLPPPQLDDFIEELISDPEHAYRETDHIADLALDWRSEHGVESTQKLLVRLINHFGTSPDDDINIDITADALVALGEVLQEEKSFAEAIPLFRRAADIHGNYPGALDDLAESLYAVGQYVEAIAAWREEIGVESDCAHCYHRIADAYDRLGQISGVASTLQELLHRRPKEIVARDRLRRLALARGNKELAEKCQREILTVRAPVGIEDITVWVKYQIDAVRFAQALRFLHRFENELGERIELRVYLLKAIVLVLSNQTEEAQNEIRRARAMPNFCQHCWDRDLETIGKLFGNELVERIKQLASQA